MMFELDKANFSKFITEQRKAKGYTQKQLAEKLFVSDKAVSKWERSLSMPDISLLVPLAEVLEVSVTELLEGRKMEAGVEMNAGKVEELVQKALNLETPEERRERRKKNGSVFWSCVILMVLEEAAVLWLLGRFWGEEGSAFAASLTGVICMLVFCGLSFGFGIYFWFFIKERLPHYYDENRISVYTHGSFSLSMPGVSFNNGNWPYIVKALRIWSAVTMVTAPLFCLLLVPISRVLPAEWIPYVLQAVALGLYLAGLFVPIYVLGRKYGKAEKRTAAGQDQAAGIRGKKRIRLFISSAVVLLVLLLILLAARNEGTCYSGSRAGYEEQWTSREWSASYRLLNGTVSRTIRPCDNTGTCILEIETMKGRLSVEMTDSAGSIVFSENDINPGVYEVQIAGAARVKFTGEKHEGSFSVTCK